MSNILNQKSDIIRKLVKSIDNIRLQQAQPALEPAVLESLAEAWYQHFISRNIPFEILGKLYNMALDARAQNTYNQPFCIEDILRAWFVYKEKEIKRQLNKPFKNCKTCNGYGFKTVKINGEDRTIPCDHK